MEQAGRHSALGTQVFYQAFNASPIGIALENLEGQILFANPALCSILGFTEEELCRKHCVEFSPAEDAEKDWALFQRLRAGVINKYHIEKRYVRRDGTLIWGYLSISLLNGASPPIVVAMVEDISDRKTAEEEKLVNFAFEGKLSNEPIATVSRKLIEAHEQERLHIAREIHDDIQQRVALAAAKLQCMRQPLSALEPVLGEQIGEVQKQLIELGSDLHALAHRLHTSKLEYLGLEATCRSFLKELSIYRNAHIKFDSFELPKELPQEVALGVFRVMQEAVQNAMKHSGGRDLQVALVGSIEDIELTVRDSGVGFDPDEAIKGPGLGLVSMRERIRSLDGELSIRSQRHLGTTIRARVRLSPK